MKPLLYLNKYLYKYRWRLTLGILCIAVSDLFAVYPAQIIRHAFDLVSESINGYRNSAGTEGHEKMYESLLHAVFLFGLTVIAIALARGIFLFLMRQTIIVMSRLIEYDLKNEVYNHYQELPQSFYKMHNTGDLMNRISEDVSRVRMYLGPGIMYTINLVILFIIVITIMFSVNSTLSLYVLLPLPVLIVGIYYVSDLINRQSDAVQERQSRLSTLAQEAFSGIRVIKSFGKEPDFTGQFRDETETYKNASLKLVTINSYFHPLVILLISISTLLTIAIGGNQAIRGKITPGNIAEFVFYVNMLTWPVASVGWVTSLIQRAAASQKRINEFLNIRTEILNNGQMKKLSGFSIIFDNITFTYPDTGITALKNISFRVEEGKSLGITGRTGSGKTTIANLICRISDSSSGTVLIGDNPVNELDTACIRNEIGYVPQDVFLFSETVFNNIAFGVRGKEFFKKNGELTKAVEEAAGSACISDEINGLPEKFNTLIGERGITLSGGQKQRLAIARALIRSPHILILDDCLSAVDTETENLILANLRKFIQNRTTIITSHRISSICHADEIIVLDMGRISERGNHEDLLAKKGLYHNLYQKQLLEELEKPVIR